MSLNLRRRKQKNNWCLHRHNHGVESANTSTSDMCLNSDFTCQGILDLDVGALASSSKQMGPEQSAEEMEVERKTYKKSGTEHFLLHFYQCSVCLFGIPWLEKEIRNESKAHFPSIEIAIVIIFRDWATPGSTVCKEGGAEQCWQGWWLHRMPRSWGRLRPLEGWWNVSDPRCSNLNRYFPEMEILQTRIT